MKIGDWLLGHYKERFDPDGTKGFIVLQHDTGSTWNDGGSWNSTIVQVGNEVIKIDMSSDYNCDKLEVTKMKTVLKETYEPV